MKSRASILQLSYFVLFVVGLGLVFSTMNASLYAAEPAQGRATPTHKPTTVLPTEEPEPTDTPEPTSTPEPTLTPTATEESAPVEPTDTPLSEQPTETPDDSPSDDDGSNDDDGSDGGEDGADSDAGCLSRVEGFLIGQDGAALPGQVVQLSGPDWSATWTTDSNGFFYFEGLCAGDLTLTGLVNDQPVATAPVSVSGAADSVTQVTLQSGVEAAPPPAPTAVPTAPPTTQPAAAPTATPQVVTRLPQTGSTTSLLLITAALFATVMIVVGAMRRRQRPS